MSGLFGEYSSRVFALGGILLTLVLGYFTVSVLLVPLVAALFLVYLLDPALVRLQRRDFSAGNAFLLIMAGFVITIGLVASFIPSWVGVESFSGSDAAFTDRLSLQLDDIEVWIEQRVPMLRSYELATRVMGRGEDVALAFFNNLPSLAASVVVNLLLVPFIAYFMIRDGKSLKRRIVSLVPNRYFEMSLIVLHRIDLQVGGYFRGRMIESVLVGIAMIVAMGALSVWTTLPYILLMGGVIGVTNLIPYVGPVMGLAFGALLYLGQGLPVASILALGIAVGIAQLLDNLVFAPVVLSKNVDLHPLTVVLVLLIGGQILGVLGLLIAVPVAASVKIVVGELYRSYQLQMR